MHFPSVLSSPSYPLVFAGGRRRVGGHLWRQASARVWCCLVVAGYCAHALRSAVGTASAAVCAGVHGRWGGEREGSLTELMQRQKLCPQPMVSVIRQQVGSNSSVVYPFIREASLELQETHCRGIFAVHKEPCSMSEVHEMTIGEGNAHVL